MVQYFQHDINAHEDFKILALRSEHGAAGYGIYFMLLELIAGTNTLAYSKNYQMLAYVLHEDEELIRSVVEDFDLFIVEEDQFYSESMLRRVSERDASAQARSEHARKAAAGRYNKAKTSQNNLEQCSSNARAEHEQNMSNAQAKDEQCSKKPLKENKENKEINILNPPPQGSSLNSEVEAAGAAEEDKDLVMIYFNLFNSAVNRVSTVTIPRGTSVSDIKKLARFLTDDNIIPAAMSCMIERKPAFEVIQSYENLETNGTIHPIPRNIWYCLVRLNSLCIADQQKILSLMRGHPEMFDDLEKVLKEIDDNPKIKQPSRYIISKLSKS